MPDSASCVRSIAHPSAAHDSRWFLRSRLVGREVLEGTGSCASTAEWFSSLALHRYNLPSGYSKGPKPDPYHIISLRFNSLVYWVRSSV